MTDITLYNTRTRSKERFAPIDPSNVRMYVCGITPYDRAHIGNARPVVVFDVLYRLLRYEYGPDHVRYVRNITDIDDKINARAAETKAPGESELQAIRRITDETIGWYHADMQALGALPPTFEPRATEYIAPMLAMIGTLVENGNAYAAEGHVLFAVGSYPDYGKFAHRSLDEMQAGARVEVAPYKRDPMDFVLWKPSGPGEPGWDSPWGRGRPGWHIECSAMSYELLGPSFDIHGGGIDLVFPHHENEIAQSRCAHPEGDFANVWMHNGFLNVEGEKMSKSLGNFFTVRDLLDRGIPGEVIRLVLLSGHYRQPMDWNVVAVHEARTTVSKFASMLGRGGTERLRNLRPGVPLDDVVKELANDLQTKKAIDALQPHVLRGQFGPVELADELERVYASQLLLGLDLKNHPKALAAAQQHDDILSLVRTKIEGFHRAHEIAEQMDKARAVRDFVTADQLRARLLAAGVEVRSGPSRTIVSPTEDFDPVKLEAFE